MQKERLLSIAVLMSWTFEIQIIKELNAVLDVSSVWVTTDTPTTELLLEVLFMFKIVL